MAIINAFYPPSGGGGTGSNASVGSNGITAPTSSTEVAGINPSGNQQPLQTTSDGALIVAQDPTVEQHVIVDSSALPSGASTSALQTSGNASLTTIATNSGTQATAANQTTGNNSLATIATQTNVGTNGAATSALQTSGNASLTTIATNSGTQATAANQTTGNNSLATIATNTSNTQGSVAAGGAATKSDLIGGVYNTTLPTLTNGQQAALQVDSSGRPILGTSSATIGTIASITNALPTGTNTLGSVKITDGTNVPGVAPASTAATSTQPALVVALSPNSSGGTAIKGTAIANAPVYNAYSTTNITTAAYVQLVASTTSVTNTVHIFDSSGQAMILGVGAAGSEVIQLYVPPGGDTYTLTIPAGSRIAYKALTATASSGYLLMSFLQ